MTTRVGLAIAAIGVVVGGSVNAQAPADRFTQKVVQVLVHAEGEVAASQRTTFTETEVNSYLSLGATEHLPPSVTRPSVAMLGAGRLSAAAIVDLDVVRGGSSGGWFDPLAYLSGRLPIVAIGTMDARGGVARLQLERTEVGGVAVPPLLLQEIVSFYTRSAEAPRGVRLDEPFPLPARIDRIEIARGQAVVVQ